jgi:phosphatidylglycerol:prolipoprotein diacylglycerol transferase
LFPVLFDIPNAWAMPGGFLVAEIVVGLASLLAWLALHLRGRKDWLAATLNTVAILVALHLALSAVMRGPEPAREHSPITIYSFGVVIILGFLAGARYMMSQTRRLGLPDRKIFDWAFWLLVVGIIGARFLYAFLNYEQFAENKLQILEVWKGGLVWYGGLIPAAVVGIILLRKYELPVLHVADVGSAAVILALGIGRWACLLAGDDYGRVTDSFLGIRFYNELVPAALRGLPLHPTQLYMSVNCLWLFFLTEWVRRRARHAGQAFAWMLILYAVSRSLWIEPFRGDFVERNPGYADHLAVGIQFEKGDGTPAVHLDRGHPVVGDRGRKGTLLSDLDLEAGEASALVYAMSDERQSRKVLPTELNWTISGVDGLPDGVEVFSDQGLRTQQGGPNYWYGSDLPRPPAYVSTSQWISVFIAACGVVLLLAFRKLGEPGFQHAVGAHERRAGDA